MPWESKDGDGLLGRSPPAYEQVQSSTWSQRLLPRRNIRHARRLVSLGLLITGLFYVNSIVSWATLSTRAQEEIFLQGLKKCYAVQEQESIQKQQSRSLSDSSLPLRLQNPRWTPQTGQKTAILLRNGTLFDGESTLASPVDVLFESGLIKSITPSSLSGAISSGTEILDLNGAFITPGLVDMHSHHLLIPFPQVAGTRDVNEMPNLGPITTFVRAIDGFKAYDPAITLIASGGVTTSLVLPGSGNIVGGEAYVIKNWLNSGAEEPVVEELLLDHGIQDNERKRYLKMACGENPKGIYGHTRMGLSWLLREHLDKARKIRESQDAWCQNALEIEHSSSMLLALKDTRIAQFILREGRRPEEIVLDTTISLLRGELNLNVHCYEPQDFERVLAVLHEFGVHVSAFHHALEAWRVPELLKQLEENITIATFAENAFFKKEGYGANLHAPRILDDHGIKVALKSDHTGEGNYAKYLMYQASVSHSFGLSTNKALQSVTSVPARSIQQSHRIGFVRPGYDADLVIWDDHPLQVGATPTQVFVDGRPILDENTVSKIWNGTETSRQGGVVAPQARETVREKQRQEACESIKSNSSRILFNSIKKILIDVDTTPSSSSEHSVLVENGQITCVNTLEECLVSLKDQRNITRIDLKNGYLTPGLIAFGNNLGIQAIAPEPSTGDRSTHGKGNALDEKHSLHFAKYGVHLHGRAFTRAKVGGVTKAITAPLTGGGFLQGVSAGLRTSDDVTVLDGGIWKDEIALHFTIGQSGIGDDTPTVGSGIERLRQVLTQGQNEKGSSSIYAQAANGSFPVVVNAVNEDDIAQLILIKRAFPSTNLVIFAGHAAALVAQDLAASSIPVILTGNRGAPDSWEKQGTLPGPPLSKSPAQVLSEAGVHFAIAVRGEFKIHGLAQEAWWAGKFSGLGERESIELVSVNIERILGIERQAGKDDVDGNWNGEKVVYEGDFVVWEGNPLKGEGSVVVAVQDDGKVGDCWPDFEGAVL